MWCVTRLILHSSIFHYLEPECPLGELSKLSCFLLVSHYFPISLFLLYLGLFGCQVTEGVPWAHGRVVSLDLSGAECPSFQSWCTLSALQLSLKLTIMKNCLAPCQEGDMTLRWIVVVETGQHLQLCLDYLSRLRHCFLVKQVLTLDSDSFPEQAIS